MADTVASVSSSSASSSSRFTGNPEAASAYLTSLINRNLHVHISDGRKFAGQLKCTDRDRNIILSCTHEYRPPSKADVEKAAREHAKEGRTGNVKVDMPRRFVGLVVVPGEYIEKVELE